MTPPSQPINGPRGDPPGPATVSARSFTRPGTCGCPYPLIHDQAAGIWRHLADGSPCLSPASRQAAA